MDNPTIDVREGEHLDLAAVDACLRQQIYYRYFYGQTRDQRFAFFGAAVAILGDCCRRVIAQSSLNNRRV